MMRSMNLARVNF